MVLLVGLGNPGTEYAGNRHNLGFMVVDAIHARFGFPAYRKKFQGQFSEGRVAGRKVWLLKPTTFMNESGRAVSAAKKFYKIEREDIIVFHDELDLALEKIRVKTGGGYAGHNGLKSIGNMVGPDFRRVRIGIGHPGEKKQVRGHVLRDFAKSDRIRVEQIVDALAQSVPSLIRGEDAEYMSKISLILKPPTHKPHPDSQTNDDKDDAEAGS